MGGGKEELEGEGKEEELRHLSGKKGNAWI